MISTVEGILSSKHPTEAVVEVGGIGILCHISLTTYTALPGEGEQVRLITEMVVRDDAIDLFAFISEAERTLFKLLKGVSGVGPRMAQGILSGLSVNEFAGALAAGDLATLTSIRGVGRKTAERLILELKEKLPHLEEVTGISLPGEPETVSVPGEEEEAVLALRSLGYSTSEAEAAVRRALAGLEGKPTVEILVKRALTLAG